MCRCNYCKKELINYNYYICDKNYRYCNKKCLWECEMKILDTYNTGICKVCGEKYYTLTYPGVSLIEVRSESSYTGICNGTKHRDDCNGCDGCDCDSCTTIFSDHFPSSPLLFSNLYYLKYECYKWKGYKCAVCKDIFLSEIDIVEAYPKPACINEYSKCSKWDKKRKVTLTCYDLMLIEYKKHLSKKMKIREDISVIFAKKLPPNEIRTIIMEFATGHVKQLITK
jgi:hypothetical protein